MGADGRPPALQIFGQHAVEGDVTCNVNQGGGAPLLKPQTAVAACLVTPSGTANFVNSTECEPRRLIVDLFLVAQDAIVRERHGQS